MRVDSDVVFLEDPYPILNGPLMAPFALVSQARGEGRPRSALWDATHHNTFNNDDTRGER
jgi:hypothetical protein